MLSQVLHKGKVLFPSSASIGEHETSKQLIELSSMSWNSRSAPSLLLVGTPSETQAEWLQNEQKRKALSKTDDKDLWTILTTLTVADVFHFGWYLTVSSIRFATNLIIRGVGIIWNNLFSGGGSRTTTNDE